jgi:hypothetical protein
VFVLVPIQNIETANKLFVERDQFQEEISLYNDISRAYEQTIYNISRQASTYDSLVTVKQSQINLYKRLGTVSEDMIFSQKKKIRHLRWGLTGTIVVALTTLILK